MNEEEQQEEHSCDDNAIYYEFIEDGHRYHGYECGICGEHLQSGQEKRMNRYMVELKKEIHSKKTFRIYISAYSISQVVEMLNDDYVIMECELKNE